jgi:hypothetical protein
MGRDKMILLSTIIHKFQDLFSAKYKATILPSHKKALHVMEQCRKETGLHMSAECTDYNCGKQIYIPHCQNHENQQWIDNQLSKRLPADYYLITFTLPEQLRDLAWKNQKTIYTLMFSCVQDVLKTFTKNDKKTRW